MIQFLKETFKHPKFTGAIAESSQGLSHLITDSAKLKSANYIVELGPGTGVFSRLILQKKNNNSKYFAIEINPSFVQQMRNNLPACQVYCDSCEHLSKYLEINEFKHADRVISGLPWTAFDSDLKNKLIKEIHKHLIKGGIFVTFAYFPFNYFSAGRKFKKLILKTFSSVKTTKIIWLNLPPAFVYICKK
ncbi:MAG: methyltransferase domain-containing protein [Minisyncoccales bacterium]